MFQRLAQQRANMLIVQAIRDSAALLVRVNDSQRPQHPQLVRNRRIAHRNGSSKIAHTTLTLLHQRQQNPQTGWIAHRFEQFGDLANIYVAHQTPEYMNIYSYNTIKPLSIQAAVP